MKRHQNTARPYSKGTVTEVPVRKTVVRERVKGLLESSPSPIWRLILGTEASSPVDE